MAVAHHGSQNCIKPSWARAGAEARCAAGGSYFQGRYVIMLRADTQSRVTGIRVPIQRKAFRKGNCDGELGRPSMPIAYEPLQTQTVHPKKQDAAFNGRKAVRSQQLLRRGVRANARLCVPSHDVQIDAWPTCMALILPVYRSASPAMLLASKLGTPMHAPPTHACLSTSFCWLTILGR